MRRTIPPGYNPAFIARLTQDMHVLLCRHIAEDNEDITSFTDAGKFTRDDNTIGNASYSAFCHGCYELPIKSIIFVEYIWKNGAFHCYDKPCMRYDSEGKLEEHKH